MSNPFLLFEDKTRAKREILVTVYNREPGDIPRIIHESNFSTCDNAMRKYGNRKKFPNVVALLFQSAKTGAYYGQVDYRDGKWVNASTNDRNPLTEAGK
jgi:hypothetical protein